MLYQLHDCTVSFGPRTVLSHIDFEIAGNEKVALVGRNGAGKTTLLKLLTGEITPDHDDKRNGPAVYRSREFTVGMLTQNPFQGSAETVEEIMLKECPAAGKWDRERYDFEKEFDRLLTGFGLAKEDKKKHICEFSGGEQTKISMIGLFLKKPDLLLLDEPTNHLDMETIEWLENYLSGYPKAVVMVSHDRFFLDRTADTVWEVSGEKLQRFPGNYTHYREEKLKSIRIGHERYVRQQNEIERLRELIERFKNKPTKAAMTRSKKKMLERMEIVENPSEDDAHIFTGSITPLFTGPKRVWEAEHLKVGYDKPLYEMSLRILRGSKTALLGPNGSGKTALLKTVAGLIEPRGGKASLGNGVTIGYFDQHSAEIESDLSVAEHYHALYPALTEKEVRTELGNFLFAGREAQKKVTDLSGGEKARLVLAETLKAAPNLLLLDEPTNHMDIPAKETIESALRAYEGTVLFVSHDRYFISRVAKSILTLENEKVMYYPFGYEHYLRHRNADPDGNPVRALVSAEDEALIAGIRAVPKAERHRLREIPVSEAYSDWRRRILWEACERARSEYERTMDMELAESAAEKPDYETAGKAEEEALSKWTSLLIEWEEIYTESGRGDAENPAVSSV